MRIAGSTESDLDHRFREAEYVLQVDGTALITHVDRANAALAGWFDSKHITCAALITAWNPYGVAFATEHNLHRQARFQAELTVDAIAWSPGEARSPDRRWCEPAALLWNVDIEAARSWAKRLEQLAFVQYSHAGEGRLIYV